MCMKKSKGISPSARSEKRYRFTLIELLVVIAIIAMLAAILLPALQQARARGIATDCIAKRKQVGVWISMYTDTFDGFLMPMEWGRRDNDSTWWSALHLAKITPWNRLDKYYGCPAANTKQVAPGCTQTNTININKRLTEINSSTGAVKNLHKINKIRSPGKKYLMTDAISGMSFDEDEYISNKISAKGKKANGFYPWHDKNKSGTMLFADMRVELIRMQNNDIPHPQNAFLGTLK